MAQKVSVQLVDDSTGEAADETVTFALDGVTYEIDLTTKNADGLREAFEPYVTAGRRVGGRRARGQAAVSSDAVDTSAVRAWASSNGIEISARGRIAKDVLEKFHAAGN